MIIETATIYTFTSLMLSMLIVAVYFSIFFMIFWVVGWGISEFFRVIIKMFTYE